MQVMLEKKQALLYSKMKFTVVSNESEVMLPFISFPHIYSMTFFYMFFNDQYLHIQDSHCTSTV